MIAEEPGRLRFVPPATDVPGRLLFQVLSGSHAHGTATPSSDEDWRGVFAAPPDAFLGLEPPVRTIHLPPDVVYWELAHFCRLLLGGNPNIVMLLWMPRDCVVVEEAPIRALASIRDRFVSAAMVRSYAGWVRRELRQGTAAITPKRLSHVVRLLYELVDAVEGRGVPVRLSGERLDHVMRIKTAPLGPELIAEVRAFADLWVPRMEARIPQLPEPPVEAVREILVATRHADLGLAAPSAEEHAR